MKIFLQSCGANREIIQDLVDAGLDILNPVQYKAKGKDLVGLKKEFGADLVFWGRAIDTQSTPNHELSKGTRDEVKKILDIMAPGGGFAFAPVHNIIFKMMLHLELFGHWGKH